MKSRSFLTALLVFSLPGLLHADWTVRGRTLEKGTRKPLSGVTVFVIEDSNRFSVSDETGRYEIILLSSGTVRLGAVGRDIVKPAPLPVVLSPNDPAPTANLYIESITYTLPQLVITAERDKVSKRVIPREELVKVAGSAGDPLKSIQSLPGIVVASDNSSSPAIRGSAPEDNEFYVDFIPVGYLFHMGDSYSIFNSDLVRDFTIYPSAFGPEFHSMNGGVIDVTLRDPRKDRFGMKLNMNTLETDFLVEGPVNQDQSFYLSGRRSYIDLLLPKTGKLGGGIDYVQFPQFFDYQGKYLWKTDPKNTLSFQTGGAGDRLILKIREDSDIAAHDPDMAGEFSAGQNYHSQGVVWTSNVSKDVVNKLAVSQLMYGFDVNGGVGNAEALIRSYYLREKLTFVPVPDHELSVGGEYVYFTMSLDIDAKLDFGSEFEPDRDFTSAARRQYNEDLYSSDYSVFAKDRWSVTSRTTVIGGGRVGYEDYLGGVFTEPWAGLEYKLTEKTLFTGGWGRYHQYPDGLQMIDTFGNRDLTHLKSEHTVAGIEQKLPEEWSLKVDGYHKDMSDLVISDDAKNYVNGASGKALGMEVLLKKQRTDRWDGWLSVSQSHSTRRNDRTGQEINFRYDQPVVLNVVGNYKLSERWSVGGYWRFHSGSPYTPVTGTYVDASGRLRPTYAGTNSSRLPDYHRLDLRVDRKYTFDRWTLSAYLEILNFYNRKNISGYTYNADYSSRKPVYQLPAFPSFGLRAEF
ncbi:MAG TPA: hypothetical protein PK876_03715 [Elusimicrobiota bacterium]|nr:hypothetical protein [Elusimicrobiota bacterium]